MSKYRELSDEFYKCTKRVIKHDLSVNPDTLNKYKTDLVDSYNNLINYVRTIETTDESIRSRITGEIKALRIRLVESFRRLETKIDLGEKLLDRVSIIGDQVTGKGHRTHTKQDDDNLLRDVEQNISDLNTTIEEFEDAVLNTGEMEAIKVIEILNRVITQTYDGSTSNLETFLGQLSLAKTVIENNQPAVFVAFVKSRLSGKALESINGVDNVPDANQGKIDFIYNALQRKIKPENSRVIQGKIKALRADNKSKLEFAKIADELADQLRMALIAESIPPEKAKEMAVEATVDMCRSNARSEIVKTVIEAKTFENASDVISNYLIQIDKAKNDKQVAAFRTSNRNYNSNRGNNNRGKQYNNNRRGNYYGNSYGYSNNGDYSTNRYNNGYNNNRNYNNRGRNNYNTGNRNYNNYDERNRGNNRNYRNNNRDHNVRYLGNGDAPTHQEMGGQSQNQSPNYLEEE